MKTSIGRWSRLVAATTCTVLCTSGPASAQGGQTDSQPDINCAASAAIFRVTTSGDMLRYNHLEPETGAVAWAPNPPRIGRSWQTLKPLAAPDGVIYAATPDGQLRRYRWNGTTWESFAGGSQHEVVGAAGWSRYTTPAYRNRITVDTNGDIYTIEPDGFLHWRSYDAAHKTWEHQVVNSEFSRFNLIVAAGPGQLYARDGVGDLWRFSYHAVSQRWTHWPELVGHDWDSFDRVLSAGADTLYGIKPNHELYWYRYDPFEGEWVNSQGLKIGVRWIDRSTTAAPSACRIPNWQEPVRPEVDRDTEAHPTLTYTRAGNVHYAYSNHLGRVVEAQVRQVDGSAGLPFRTVLGTPPVIGPLSVIESAAARLDLVATGWDADARHIAQTAAGGPWTKPADLGGFFEDQVHVLQPGPHPDGPGPSTENGHPLPPIPPMAPGSKIVFGIDDEGGVWTRSQITPSAPFDAWRYVDDTPFYSDTMTVLDSPRGVRLVGLGEDGRIHVATYVGNAVGHYTALSPDGDYFDGPPAAVVMHDGTLAVLGNEDGELYLTREDTDGDFSSWQELDVDGDGDWEAYGKPSIMLATNGGLIAATRAEYDDDRQEPYPYVLFSGQVAPGSLQWTEWNGVEDDDGDGVPTMTDPELLQVPDENTWVVGFRDPNQTPHLFRHRGNTEFDEIPLILPRK